ncbi:hypothetical protein NDR87_03720 [Nocardia sp. CDC159]|uniref:Uncharacterized protein n=1 Tax=Nocardia pulmonis TaxID=2951408 RepID=A0A9X2E1I5_9NOCA|nr:MULTISPECIES: hypothetical protein [Nocardia]MCM6771875.1 hypothetical protein [Nocardia pulmonis]MCM6785467.1 hypothetical protein [Nocardia sp. CDC159]
MQLVRGLQWVRAAAGDPLAVLLRGHPADGWPVIADPVSHSTTGTVLVGGAHAGTVFAASTGLADWRPTGSRVMAVAAEDIEPADPAGVAALADTPAPAVTAVPGELTDLVPAAELLCARAYAELLGAEPDDLLGATPVLDNLLCPQRAAATERMLAAVDALRAALGARTPAFFLAVVAPRLTADLVTRTAAALLADGRWPDTEGAVERTRAAHPPVRLQLTTTGAEVTVAGEVIPGNSQVAVLTRPDALPRWVELPVVYATADAVLTAIARRHPRLVSTGAPLDRPLAPATGGLDRLPVAPLPTEFREAVSA